MRSVLLLLCLLPMTALAGKKAPEPKKPALSFYGFRFGDSEKKVKATLKALKQQITLNRTSRKTQKRGNKSFEMVRFNASGVAANRARWSGLRSVELILVSDRLMSIEIFVYGSGDAAFTALNKRLDARLGIKKRVHQGLYGHTLVKRATNRLSVTNLQVAVQAGMLRPAQLARIKKQWAKRQAHKTKAAPKGREKSAPKKR